MSEHANPSLETYVETRFNLLNELIKSMESHLVNRLQEMDLRYQQHFDAQTIAITKAEASTERRLESVNEFRQVLTDQTNNLMPRTETTQLILAVSEKISKVENRLDVLEGKMFGNKERSEDSQATVKTWVMIAAVIISLLALFAKFYK